MSCRCLKHAFSRFKSEREWGKGMGYGGRWKLQEVRGRAYKNLLGTVLLHRGFPSSFFEHF